MIRKLLTSALVLVAFGVALAEPVPNRQILVCVGDQASPAVRQAVEDLAKSWESVPVLKGLVDTQSAKPAVLKSSEEVLANYDLAAYNHILVVGLKSNDPLVEKVWEHYATVDEEARTIYMQGWGHLQGDIGYVESDRNPFLHSRRIRKAPFFTLLFKISGTSEKGVLAGLDAFKAGMLNGLVPSGGFTRPQETILDLAPLTEPAPFALPQSVILSGAPDANGKAEKLESPLIGWTQVPANEYRAYIDAAGFEPKRMWRYKYLEPHAYAQPGFGAWLAGVHRMAYGNAVTIAQFETLEQAQKTANGIGQRRGWKKIDIAGRTAYQADQPHDRFFEKSPGTVIAIASGRYLLMSSLPASQTEHLMPAQ